MWPKLVCDSKLLKSVVDACGLWKSVKTSFSWGKFVSSFLAYLRKCDGGHCILKQLFITLLDNSKQFTLN